MPTTLGPREEFIENNWGWSMPVPAGSEAEAWNTTIYTQRAVWD